VSDVPVHHSPKDCQMASNIPKRKHTGLKDAMQQTETDEPAMMQQMQHFQSHWKCGQRV